MKMEPTEIQKILKEEVCASCPYKECVDRKEIEKQIAIYKQVWPDIHKAEEASEEDDDSVVTIEKTVPDKQLIFGWANICKTKNGQIPLDWSGDVMNAEDLEIPAYAHVLKYRATGERHQGEAKGILVESVMFTKEKMAAMGIPEGIVPEGWWVGYYIPDADVFAKCKNGEYNMFSIQGGGHRQDIKEGAK